MHGRRMPWQDALQKMHSWVSHNAGVLRFCIEQHALFCSSILPPTPMRNQFLLCKIIVAQLCARKLNTVNTRKNMLKRSKSIFRVKADHIMWQEEKRRRDQEEGERKDQEDVTRERTAKMTPVLQGGRKTCTQYKRLINHDHQTRRRASGLI